ncbi:MAG: ATP-binding protein, partial [Candidatus Auribacterota bacterium]|nr:ATP-binding protein [Candidatus Auribacterota bacterium]
NFYEVIIMDNIWALASLGLAALSFVLLIWLIILLVKLKKLKFQGSSPAIIEEDQEYPGTGEEIKDDSASNRRALQARARFFFEEAQTYNIIIGMDGRIIDLNRAFLNIFEKEKKDLIGKDILELVGPDQRENFSIYISRHRDDKFTSVREVEFSGKQGGRRILFGERHLTVVRDYVPVGILISGIDVTSLRQVETQEDELKKKLSLSIRMETLGIMAGGIAHDLKNLFNPVLSYPDFILKELPPDSPLAEPVMRIKTAASRAAELILNFLSLARRGRLELEPININDVITAYQNSTGFKTLGSRFPRVTIKVELSQDVTPVLGIAPQLMSIIMNLVRNGCEAMEEGGELRVSTYYRKLDAPHKGWQQIPRGEYIVIKVSDEGKGIKPDDLPTIFSPFSSGKKMGQSGSGLGLVVVSSVIEDFNGYIDVQSEPGRGTDFDIYFPVLPDADDHSDRDLSGVEKLLIVDDNEEDRKETIRILSSLGYEPISFSGEDAVEYLKDNQVDLVVIDLMLEYTGGLDLYSRILEMKPGQKCVIVSGFLNSGDCRRASNMGVTRCVEKPVDRERLGRAVRGELDRT